MPRKEKPELAEPLELQTPEAVNRFARWRRSVVEILTAKWQHDVDVESVAATVVGMFDAGASDEEVAYFLRSQEVQGESHALLTFESRLALAQELHKSAALPTSTVSEQGHRNTSA